MYDVTAGRSFYGPGASRQEFSFILIYSYSAVVPQMGCMPTSPEEMRHAEWRSSLSTLVRTVYCSLSSVYNLLTFIPFS